MLLDYIWVSDDNTLNTKTRVLDIYDETSLVYYKGIECGDLNYTVTLVPKKVVKYNENHYIVLCDTWVYDENFELMPHISNKRHFCAKEFRLHKRNNIFEIQQDFYLMNNNKPYGLNNTIVENKNYCKVGNGKVFGRKIINEVLDTCVLIGLNVSEVQSENGCSQWSFKVKGTDVDAADQVILFRYVLSLICEEFDVYPEFKPVPLPGLHPSGMVVEFSTPGMRENYECVQKVLKPFSQNHKSSMVLYGDNSNRLSNLHKTTFTYGIAKGDVSVCIPNETYIKKAGSLIDYRPASDANPYEVLESIIRTIHKQPMEH